MSTIALNPNIKLSDGYNRKTHSKASEEYLAVEFIYESKVWRGWVPVEYRRTGLGLIDINDINAHLNQVYSQIGESFDGTWLTKQETYWKEEKSRSKVTKPFFDVLAQGGWKCVNCQLPPNPNFARRIQDLKEFGYTLATDTNRFCSNCDQNKTHLMLLKIQRGQIDGNGYETWSPTLRKRMLKVLGNIDVYENRINLHSLPDHKFPEIRWDSQTKADNPDTMTDAEIKAKYQLLTNQRNQQKREVCRECYQTGKRGVVFGIPYYYKGNQEWDKSFPRTGKEAEKGCEGCGWYDVAKWRQSLTQEHIQD